MWIWGFTGGSGTDAKGKDLHGFPAWSTLSWYNTDLACACFAFILASARKRSQIPSQLPGETLKLNWNQQVQAGNWKNQVNTDILPAGSNRNRLKNSQVSENSFLLKFCSHLEVNKFTDFIKSHWHNWQQMHPFAFFLLLREKCFWHMACQSAEDTCWFSFKGTEENWRPFSLYVG